MRAILFAAAAAMLGLSLAACETATPFQPAPPGPNAAGYGYRDYKVDDTHWRVSFAGNSLTSRETVEKYLLYRAAQLTVQQGFDWFEAGDKHTDKNSSFLSTGGPYFGAYGWAPYWRFGGPRGWGGWGPWGFGGDVDIQQVSRFEASADIVMGHGPAPEGQRIFNAREVVQNLGPSIAPPKP